MDNHKFCFIMCTNDELYMEESLLYISLLEIPEEYSIDVLTVTKATSMAAGYNEGMQASDAKYKIYMHQDVFIYNKKFLFEVLEIFKSDDQIGMIGTVGTPQLANDGIMWHGIRYGSLYGQDSQKRRQRSDAFTKVEIGYMEMQGIDGLLMITQYDLFWREDLFQRWDFYDVSQSMEFLRSGKKVVVPALKEPWCAHDCGFINLNDYHSQRDVFLNEYGKDLYENTNL